ncbi:anti-sigma factor [Paenibacillus sp. PR3]|uniref:Anti-sigma factor n=1 Tax=Paenibacillus terricola TaxID=2763503 RepID=A0ABR8MTZ7_9BACL|nr:anti-sigma factor [Paenibacillus terricola]MBD3919437.1 anti-sigma factor [Paenibacillus terricola]
MSGMHSESPMCKRMYREEDWIDWLLGSKRPEEQDAMQMHLLTCHKCREIVEQWAPLMQVDLTSSSTPIEASMPSNEVYKRLRRQVRATGVRLRLRNGIQSKGKWMAGIAAGILLLLCVWSITRFENERPEDQRTQYVAHYEPNAVSFMSDPSTASYRVHPYNEQLGEGYVYYNDNSLELLVLLEGVLSSEGKDVQAWAVDEEGHASLGLLQQDEADRAHLYLKGEALGKAHHIVLTVEPEGGSKQPTSSDAFVFHIQK